MDRSTKRRLYDELRVSDEAFFGWSDEVHLNYQLDPAGLDFIHESVAPGDRTLETGAGHSTVAFALGGAYHTVVAPFETEQERIRTWCAARDIDTSRVTFIVGESQHVLPTLDGPALDLVLVDGDHAFPTPFIDWYYAALRLRVGGLMMIDDVHIRTGEVLDDFLGSEASRWRLVVRNQRNVVYEKLSPDIIDFAGWMSQPWCMRPPSMIERLRGRMRLRTRLRSLTR